MTLRILPLLISLAALAGCSAFNAPFSTPKSAPGTPQRVCEDAAEADRSLNDQAVAMTAAARPGEFSQNLDALRRQSVMQCLQQRSVTRGGGVDKVKNQ